MVAALHQVPNRCMHLFLLLLLVLADMRADVQDIFKMTPHDKQVMMFSATLDKDMRAVCKKFMSNVRVSAVSGHGGGVLRGISCVTLQHVQKSCAWVPLEASPAPAPAPYLSVSLPTRTTPACVPVCS